MAVIEAGLIISGIPIVRSEYAPSEKFGDPFIRIGLFTAIQAFAAQAFSDEAEEMKFKKYVIVIRDLNPGEKMPILLYAVAERGTDASEIKNRLENISRTINIAELILDSPASTDEIKKIKRKIDREMQDLKLTPADRAKFVFG